MDDIVAQLIRVESGDDTATLGAARRDPTIHSTGKKVWVAGTEGT